MSLSVTLDLPDLLAQDADLVAKTTKRRLEDVLLEWLSHGAISAPIEALSNEQLLTVSELQLPEHLQSELSNLLNLNREEQLNSDQRTRLDELMQLYRRGLVRKAQAIKEAVNRGLRPPLSEE
ncbi:MAG: hypothetical protein R3A44_32395 [Caldilineaceae bacterium]